MLLWLFSSASRVSRNNFCKSPNLFTFICKPCLPTCLPSHLALPSNLQSHRLQPSRLLLRENSIFLRCSWKLYNEYIYIYKILHDIRYWKLYYLKYILLSCWNFFLNFPFLENDYLFARDIFQEIQCKFCNYHIAYTF